MNQDGTLAWITSVSIDCNQKSLTVDNAESYLYFAVGGGYLIAIRLSSSTGSIIDQRKL